ncbi:MAG: peptidoglycan-binding domain-containing protein [Syntrophomonadaceae bacterium]|nr:peptidoglycan-binding domain-containing protein [Syntrophomonadaceae bacterium]
MNRKVIITVLIIGLLSISACGQNSPKTAKKNVAQPMSATTGTQQKKIMRDEEFIETLGQPETGSTKQDDDIVELRHWKYGVKPPTPQDSTPKPAKTTTQPDPLLQLKNPVNQQDAADYRKPIAISIISEKEMDIICANLVKMQYLPDSGFSEADFKAAVIKFQTDNSLKATGNLDTATLELLLAEP